MSPGIYKIFRSKFSMDYQSHLKSACLFLFIILQLACHSSKIETENKLALSNSSWILYEVQEVQVEVLISLSFDSLKVSGMGVCNRYNSSYQISKNRIQFEPIMATKVGCRSNQKLENQFFDLLSSGHRFKLLDDRLTIISKKGTLDFHPATYVLEKR